MPDSKIEIIAECQRLLDQKKNLLNQQLLDISDSLENETKSSVGDKHETARARMQTEQDNLTGQLNEILQQLNGLSRLNLQSSDKIQKGSLVETTQGVFLIGPPLGKISVKNQDLYVISSQSPLGKILCGQMVGSEFTNNSRKYRITNIE